MQAGKIRFVDCLLATGMVAATLAGCASSDLSEFHAVEKTKSRSDARVAEVSDSAGNTANKTDIAIPADQELSVSALAPVNVVDGGNVSGLLKAVPAEPSSVAANPTIQPASATSEAPKTESLPTPRKLELLVPDKTFQRDAISKAFRVSYDDLDLLKVLNMEPVPANAVDYLPRWLKDLNGQRIRIRGFMFPTFESEGIERFVLARDNQICCFGRDPKVYDLIQVDMRNGKSTNYIPATRAFDVIGRFKIEMISEDGKPFGLYYIEDAEIVDR